MISAGKQAPSANIENIPRLIVQIRFEEINRTPLPIQKRHDSLCGCGDSYVFHERISGASGNGCNGHPFTLWPHHLAVDDFMHRSVASDATKDGIGLEGNGGAQLFGVPFFRRNMTNHLPTMLHQVRLNMAGQLEIVVDASFWVGDEMEGTSHAGAW